MLFTKGMTFFLSILKHCKPAETKYILTRANVILIMIVKYETDTNIILKLAITSVLFRHLPSVCTIN